MPCEPDELKHVPLFELLDDEELAVLAAQVDLKRFAPRQRIFKIGEPSRQAYVVLSGSVRVTTVDEDQQEVLIDEPGHGGFFGFASMLDETPHQSNAMQFKDQASLDAYVQHPSHQALLQWLVPLIDAIELDLRA